MTTSISSSTTAQLLVAADGSRTSLTIQNTDVNELFLGLDSSVLTTSFAYRRPYGTGYTFTPPESYRAWYGVWDADGVGAALITEVSDPVTDTNGAFSTYGDLKSEIAAWLRPNSTPSADMLARIPVYVGLAEVMIRRELHLRALDDTEATLAITSGVATVPAGFQSVLSMTLTTDPYNQIRPLPLDQIERMDPTSVADQPFYYTRSGPDFVFYPKTTGTAKLRFRRGVTPLNADGDTNWILAAHPDVYLYGALVHADRRLIGPRLGEWKEGFVQAIDSIRGLEMNLHTDAIFPQPSGFVV